MPGGNGAPASSYDIGSATWQVMHLEGTLFSIQEAMVHDNAPEVRRLMEQAQAALEGFKGNNDALALLDQGPFNEASRDRILQVCSEKYVGKQSLHNASNNLARHRPDYLRNGKNRRSVLTLRGGHGEETSTEIDPRTPVLKAGLAYKVFNCLDDPVISLGLIFINLLTTIVGFISDVTWIAFLGTFTLYIMVVTQVLEIFLHSGYARRMLEEKTRVRIRAAFDAQAYPIDGEGMFIQGAKSQKITLLPGSEGSVAYLRERRLSPHRVDDGAFVQFDGNENNLCYVPWYKYKNVIIFSDLKDYFSNWMNTFNTVLLAFCVVSLYVFKAGKAAVAMRVFLICLRIIRPVLRLFVSSKKVSKYGAGSFDPQEDEQIAKEEFGWKCC